MIGASTKPKYGGSHYVMLLKTANYPNPVYPVNPKYEGKEISGYKIYGSISSLPDDPPIDLAIIAVPAKITPSILEELGKKRIPFAHIFSSGYSELGEEGQKLEKELITNATKYGVRILGPN